MVYLFSSQQAKLFGVFYEFGQKSHNLHQEVVFFPPTCEISRGYSCDAFLHAAKKGRLLSEKILRALFLVQELKNVFGDAVFCTAFIDCTSLPKKNRVCRALLNDDAKRFSKIRRRRKTGNYFHTTTGISF